MIDRYGYSCRCWSTKKLDALSANKGQIEQPSVGGFFAVEIPITNIERSQKFYEELFGWEFGRVLPRGSHNIQTLHFFANAAKTLHGALLLLDEGHAPRSAGVDNWGLFTTIVVPNVVEAVKKVESMSGVVKTYVAQAYGERP